MKFVKQEETNRKKTRYYFLLGRSEVTLMLLLVEKAYMYTPNLPITIPLRSTLRNMQVALIEALPQIDENNDWVDTLELVEKNGVKKIRRKNYSALSSEKLPKECLCHCHTSQEHQINYHNAHSHKNLPEEKQRCYICSDDTIYSCSHCQLPKEEGK